MSLLQLDTRMVVQLLLSSCSLHSECECWWVSLLSGWKSVQQQMLMWLVLADVHDADTSAGGPARAGFPAQETCGVPFKLSRSSTCPFIKSRFPNRTSLLPPARPVLWLCRASVQGCCRHLAVALSPTQGKPTNREERYCLQSMFSYVSYQTNIYFPPEFDGLLVAANCIFSDTYSAVNRISNSAELVFIIPNVSVAAVCAFAAGVCVVIRLVVVKSLKKQETM